MWFACFNLLQTINVPKWRFFRNQEYLEVLKKNISEKQDNENESLQASSRSNSVLNSIKLTIIDLIHKLEEVYVTTGSIEIEANEITPNNALLQVKDSFYRIEFSRKIFFWQ